MHYRLPWFPPSPAVPPIEPVVGWLPVTSLLSCALVACALAAALSGCDRSQYCADSVGLVTTRALSIEASCEPPSRLSIERVEQSYVVYRCICPTKDGGW